MSTAPVRSPDGEPLERLLDAQRVFTLYRVGKLVSASLDRDATLNAITDAAHQLTNAQQTALYLFDEMGDLELQVVRGTIPALSGQELPADHGLLGRAIRERRVIAVSDVQLEQQVDGANLDEELTMRSCLAAPLIWKDEILGAVTTGCAQPGALTEADVVLVSELAEQAAAAVAHARDFADEQRLRAESEEILRQFAEQEVQLDRAQQQLVHNEKMTAVGQLVHGLAHEMNTPLSVVTSNMSVLQGYVSTLSNIARAAAQLGSADDGTVAPDDALRAALAEDDLNYVLEDLPALIEDSTAATLKVAAMVRSMGSLARHDRGNREPVQLVETIESALTLASNSLKKDATVKCSLAPVPLVTGHATELTQVFVHVLMNAAQALEDRPGTVTVETTHVSPWVIARITDTGAGIPADQLKRVFQPFFSTRGSTEGSGMGLAVSEGIITRHGGEISLESTLGKGTTVTIRLPAGDAQRPDGTNQGQEQS